MPLCVRLPLRRPPLPCLRQGRQLYRLQSRPIRYPPRRPPPLLLDAHPRTAGIIERISALPLSYEYMNLFFGLDVSPSRFGIERANHWIYRDWNTSADVFWDVDNPAHQGSPKIIFLNSSSQRDPEFGLHGNVGHNGQVVFIGKQRAFEPWQGTRWRKRGDDYQEAKERFGQALIGALDRRFPGLAEHVVRHEVSTNLTYEHFSGHPRGIPYGIAPIPERYRSLDLRPQTPIRGLFLCGQDLVMPGVSAAFGSAMMCSSLILRRDVGGQLKRRGRRIVGS